MVAVPVDTGGGAGDAAETVRRAGTSFYWAMRLLPRPKREAMFALYAFCRAVDDIADEAAPRADKLAGLDAWRADLDRLYRGDPPVQPLARALAGPIARYGLSRDAFEEILRGMQTDAEGPVRAPEMADLERYCARVAGAVGLQSVRIFGCRDANADAFALATGQALQLTNILRDLAEDAADGRLYLPVEALDAAGIAAREPDAVLADPRLGDACAWVADHAAANYRHAAELRAAMAPADAASLRPAAIMTAVYGHLFAAMAARGWHRVLEPMRLGKGAKLWLALRCLLTGG